MESEDPGVTIWGGGLLTLLCLYWFWSVALVPHTASEPPWVFLDFANLIFHEAGHLILLPFGDFLHVLGGSLFQLLIPGIVLGTFIGQGQRLASGFALFWLGESALNLSYYIADARAQELPLLGGDPSGHDWTWLLDHMNALPLDTLLGQIVHVLAFLTMLGGIGWMVYAIYRAYTDGKSTL